MNKKYFYKKYLKKPRLERKLVKIILVLLMCITSIAFFVTSCGKLSISADHAVRKVQVRADGTLMVNQKPFFPFGLYHVSWDSTEKERMKHLQEIANAGFNLIHASAPILSEYGAFLDKANQLGISVISEHNIDSLPNFVKTFKDKPAVLGWKLADDVDIYKNGKGFTPKQIVDLHHQIKRIDPEHITYIAGAIDTRISEFVNTADAIGATAYPLGHAEKQPISWSYHMVSTVQKAAAKHHLTTAALQAFRWSRKDAPLPSPHEIRNLTYQALLGGAKGLLYYTYYDEAWYLPEHPELWKGLKSLVPEIKSIDSMVLNGDSTEIKTGKEDLKAGIWVHKNQALAVLINMSYKKAMDVEIQLPRNINHAGIRMFKHYPSDLRLENGRIFGSLKPLDVQIYKIFT
jgi:hypothetical protein